MSLRCNRNTQKLSHKNCRYIFDQSLSTKPGELTGGKSHLKNYRGKVHDLRSNNSMLASFLSWCVFDKDSLRNFPYLVKVFLAKVCTIIDNVEEMD